MIEEKVNISLDENNKHMDKLLDIDGSYDINCRNFKLQDKDLSVYFVNSLVDSKMSSEILKSIFFLNNKTYEKNSDMNLGELICNNIIHLQVEKCNDFDQIITNVLCGLIVIFIDGNDEGIIVDTRSYPSRGTQEPPNEVSVGGSRDGFVENIIVNTGLVRRRIRDTRLRFEMIKLTDVSKTDISICYIDGVAKDSVIKQVKETLLNSNLKNVIMGENIVYEALLEKKFFPLPAIKQTERPDTFGAELSKGKVGVLVDNSPIALILPIVLLDLATNVLEHTEPPFIAFKHRLLSFIAIIVSFSLLPLWVYVCNSPEIVPNYLEFILIDPEFKLNATIQVFIILLFYELINAATFHAPSITKASVSLSATFLLTVAGSDMKLFSPQATLFVIFTDLIFSAIPSRNLSAFYHFNIYFLILITHLFGLYGFFGFIIMLIIYLSRQRTYGLPFLYPFIPFNFRKLKEYIIQRPLPSKK